MASYFSFICAIAAIPLVTCANDVPREQQANYDGNVAYHSKRYDAAIEDYKKSLSLADQAGDRQYAAIAMFGLARSYAQLCQVAEAEKWFKQSIAAREALPNIHHAHLTQNLLEYARFLVGLGRYSGAATLYDRAIPMLESLGMEADDPLGYALVLDEYESLLKHTERASEASSVAARAKLLRETRTGRDPKFRPEAYPACVVASAPA
jgi:tetratricopeptide (TPR) repeat protein